MIAMPHTIVRCTALLRSSHPSKAIAIPPAAIPSQALTKSVEKTGFISSRGCGDRCSGRIREHHLSGSPQIAALTIILQVRNFDGDTILLFTERGRRYRIVRRRRCDTGEIDDATWHCHIGIEQSEGGRTANLEADVDPLAYHRPHPPRALISHTRNKPSTPYATFPPTPNYPQSAPRPRHQP